MGALSFVILLPLTCSAWTLKLRKPRASSLLSAPASSETAGRRWAERLPPAQTEAVFRARNDTVPGIWPNVSDYEWYKGDYAKDADNALERLSFTTDATGLTAEQIKEENAKTKAALDVLLPRVEAEAAEAKEYYLNNYPYIAGDPLDEWTRYRYSNRTDATAAAAATASPEQAPPTEPPTEQVPPTAAAATAAATAEPPAAPAATSATNITATTAAASAPPLASAAATTNATNATAVAAQVATDTAVTNLLLAAARRAR